MKPAAPTVVFAVRTAKGEQRRIRSFLKQIEELGVELDTLPPTSMRALKEADRFLNRYLDLLARETPSPEQLVGVMEALGGIDRVVKNAMAEILKSLGWRPEKRPGDEVGTEPLAPMTMPRAKPGRAAAAVGKDTGRGKVIPFPGPRGRKPVS